MSDVNKSIGGQNRYTFTCDYVQQKRYFGVCLWLMKSFDEGKLQYDARREDCGTAMKCGQCPAVKMRAEEIAADKAIYFTDPENPPSESHSSKVDKTSASYIRGWNQVGSAIGREDSNFKTKTVARKPAPAKTTTVINSDVGSLISAELKKEATKNAAMEQLRQLRDEIQQVMKSDPAKARELLIKAKTIKDTLTA